ncbi:MAG: ribonuclease HII [Candidatus Limnocylindrus sp.]
MIGIDEVGLAPLAGPVVACAILMPEGDLIEGVRDSKTLSRRQREHLDPIIRRAAVAWGIGAASAREVERLNPRAASHLAMQRAVRALERRHGRPVEFALVDGAPARELNDLIGAHETVVKGDASVYSIACASIVAKVLRDRLMRQLDRRYPGYGWTSNAGYPAPAHIAALNRLGVTPHHRRTYAPVADRISRAEGGR